LKFKDPGANRLQRGGSTAMRFTTVNYSCKITKVI